MTLDASGKGMTLNRLTLASIDVGDFAWMASIAVVTQETRVPAPLVAGLLFDHSNSGR
jgi:hypothetical protein